MNDDLHGPSLGSRLRSVAVVAKQARPEVLDTVLEAGDYDVIFVEQVSRAYSCIKRAAPQLVIVCLEIDDLETYGLLSMLALDEETAAIPVCTYIVPPAIVESDEAGVGSFTHFSTRPIAAAMMN